MIGLSDWHQRFEAIMHLELSSQCDGSHDLGHLRRVWAMAQHIAQAENAGDPVVLMAASYLHDLVNLPKNASNRAEAATLSAEKARDILENEAYPPDLIPVVCHAIEAHSFSGKIEPETIEAKIIQDADRLDALGPLGVARCFYIAGKMGSALFDHDDPEAQDRPLNDTHFALDHFEVKLFGLPGNLHTQTARDIGFERVGEMRAYRDALLSQIRT